MTDFKPPSAGLNKIRHQEFDREFIVGSRFTRVVLSETEVLANWPMASARGFSSTTLPLVLKWYLKMGVRNRGLSRKVSGHVPKFQRLVI
jgi:hypothetical protein